jgi:hypothetical protein
VALQYATKEVGDAEEADIPDNEDQYIGIAERIITAISEIGLAKSAVLNNLPKKDYAVPGTITLFSSHRTGLPNWIHVCH